MIDRADAVRMGSLLVYSRCSSLFLRHHSKLLLYKHGSESGSRATFLARRYLHFRRSVRCVYQSAVSLPFRHPPNPPPKKTESHLIATEPTAGPAPRDSDQFVFGPLSSHTKSGGRAGVQGGRDAHEEDLKLPVGPMIVKKELCFRDVYAQPGES